MRLGLGIGLDISNKVGGAVAPAFTSAPVVSGTAVVGQTLTTTNGVVTGTPPITYSYQWYRGASAISGATSSTYVLVQADAGNTSNIKCVVTATNAGGSASADSNTVARVLDTLTNAYITGLTLTSAEIDSFNTLYLGIRSNNYHTEIDRLNIYGSATQAAANKSLFGSFTASGINSPSWSRKIGYTHTGTSTVNTNWNPSVSAVKFGLDSHSIGNRTDNKNNTTTYTGGCQTNPTPDSLIQCAVITSTAMGYGSLSTQSIWSIVRSGQNHFSLRRTSNAGFTAYLDNTANSFPSATRTQQYPNLSWYDGSRNLNGTVNLPCESGSISVYSWHASGNVNPLTLNSLLDNFITSL